MENIFKIEELFIKVLICLNYSWKPKVIVIFESMDLSPMDLTNLFGKLYKHEMELKILVDDEEGDKNKKILSLKIEEEKYLDFDG